MTFFNGATQNAFGADESAVRFHVRANSKDPPAPVLSTQNKLCRKENVNSNLATCVKRILAQVNQSRVLVGVLMLYL